VNARSSLGIELFVEKQPKPHSTLRSKLIVLSILDFLGGDACKAEARGRTGGPMCSPRVDVAWFSSCADQSATPSPGHGPGCCAGRGPYQGSLPNGWVGLWLPRFRLLEFSRGTKSRRTLLSSSSIGRARLQSRQKRRRSGTSSSRSLGEIGESWLASRSELPSSHRAEVVD